MVGVEHTNQDSLGKSPFGVFFATPHSRFLRRFSKSRRCTSGERGSRGCLKALNSTNTTKASPIRRPNRVRSGLTRSQTCHCSHVTC